LTRARSEGGERLALSRRIHPMKKIFAIVIVAMFGFTFGCGATPPAVPTTPETPAVETPATPDVPAVPETDTAAPEAPALP
jgi:hypothetical protein